MVDNVVDPVALVSVNSTDVLSNVAFSNFLFNTSFKEYPNDPVAKSIFELDIGYPCQNAPVISLPIAPPPPKCKAPVT